MTLTHRTSIGILWNFAQQLALKGVGFLVTLFLARYLAPTDFGLLAMMAVFVAIATTLMSSGLQQALVRMKNAQQVDFNTAFYANLILGGIAYLLLFACAPLVSSFYQEPRLIILIRIAGLVVLINAFSVVQVASLSRQLNFKTQLKASIPASIVSGSVAVILAYFDYGVWALIAQMLVAAFINTVLLWRFQGWRPTLGFSKNALAGMYNFGYKLFLSGLLDTIFTNLYVIVIAKIFTTQVAGFYFFADKIKTMVLSQLVSSIQTVTYPALAAIQDDDTRLKGAYRKIVAVTTFILFPAILLLAALAEPLFRLLLPERWLPAATYLQLMCIAGLLFPVHVINLNILTVKGRSDLFFYLEIIKKLTLTLILVVSVGYGVVGILYGQIIFSVLAYIPNSYFSSKLLNYSVSEQLADFLPGLILSGVIALAVSGGLQLVQWQPLLQLIVFGLAASVLYLVGAHLLKLHAYELAYELLLSKLAKTI